MTWSISEMISGISATLLRRRCCSFSLRASQDCRTIIWSSQSSLADAIILPRMWANQSLHVLRFARKKMILDLGAEGSVPVAFPAEALKIWSSNLSISNTRYRKGTRFLGNNVLVHSPVWEYRYQTWPYSLSFWEVVLANSLSSVRSNAENVLNIGLEVTNGGRYGIIHIPSIAARNMYLLWPTTRSSHPREHTVSCSFPNDPIQ